MRLAAARKPMMTGREKLGKTFSALNYFHNFAVSLTLKTEIGMVWHVLYPGEQKRKYAVTRVLVAFLVLFSLAEHVARAQQVCTTSCVVDGHTGEPLPYAGIYVIGKREGTIANSEGEFCLTVAQDDTLRFTFVGYNPHTVRVSEVGGEVRLLPMSTDLREVTVLPTATILRHVYQRLASDYASHKKDRSDFFMRQVYDIAGTREMVEGFLQGKSAVNLRDILFYSGRHFRASAGKADTTSMVFSNLHFPLALGPQVHGEAFWKRLSTPFGQMPDKDLEESGYAFNIASCSDNEGGEMLQIDFRRDEDKGKDGSFLEGKLLVDARTYRPLALVGEVKNLQMDLQIGSSSRLEKRPVTLHVRVGYDPNAEYTKVRDVVTELACMGTHCHSVLVDVEGRKANLRTQKARSNLLEAINQSAYDSTLWSDEIIKRSQEEENIMKSKVEGQETGMGQEHFSHGQFPPLQGGIADDSLRALASRVAAYARKTPQEIVSVHMDNNCYFLGDTLWYKAYVLRDGKMTLSDISGVLYAELINQDGYLVERQTLRLRDGMACGSFCIPDTAYAGYYELRAYTRWQLNWGVCEHSHQKAADRWFLRKDMAREFYRDYDKLYSRVFPVYDKPKEAGDYSQVMTLRPLRRYYKLRKEKPDAEVTLYPEGGNWVNGLRQRLAFEAVSEKGEHLDGQLVIRDARGDTVAVAQTEHRGRGVLEMTALAGERYQAEFHWGNGLVAKVDLPRRDSEGVCLHAAESEAGLEIKVTRAKLQNVPLGLTVMQNGAVRYQCEVNSEGMTVPKGCLDAGVAQVTVFDRSGRVWADRLLFCCQEKVQAMSVSVTGLPAVLPSYGKSTLRLKASSSGCVSVSIRDKAYSTETYDNGDLLTEALLCSQIKGFVENPGYYFEADDSTHRRHLDLLLMVQGWRRHEWREMLRPFRMSEPFEVSPILRGDVYGYTARNPEDLYYTQPVQDISAFKNLYPTGGACGPKIEEVRRRVEDTEKMPESADAPKPTIEAKMNWYSMGTGTRMQQDREKALQAGFYSTEMEEKYGTIYNSQYLKRLADEMEVGAQFSVLSNQASNKELEIMAETRKGQFALQAPHSDAPYYLHLMATRKGKKADLVLDSDEYPGYSVRLRQPYPRFVKPYSFYQTHLPEYAEYALEDVGDSTSVMPEVTVGARRGGLRVLDLNKPALVVDAYEAYNQVVDAGLMPAWLCGSLFFSLNLGRLYIGDMGIPRSYDLERRWSGRTASFFTSIGDQLRYNHLRNLDKVLIYTDYAPRLEGDRRYQAANQPSVTVNLVALPDNMERVTSRDRMYVMTGYSVCEDFYQPHYEQRPLPEHTDYRRTLYWNPNVRLDSKGEAVITVWGNGHDSEPSVSIEGLNSRGQMLRGAQ